MLTPSPAPSTDPRTGSRHVRRRPAWGTPRRRGPGRLPGPWVALSLTATAAPALATRGPDDHGLWIPIVMVGGAAALGISLLMHILLVIFTRGGPRGRFAGTFGGCFLGAIVGTVILRNLPWELRDQAWLELSLLLVPVLCALAGYFATRRWAPARAPGNDGERSSNT